jgi:hypothetical protein
VRTDLARRQGMQDHLGGRLDLAHERSALARKAGIDKGKESLGM